MKKLHKWTVTLLATAALVTIVVLATGSGAAIAAKVDGVFVTNTPSDPVPVAQQVATKHVSRLLETGTEDSFSFPEIKASLITASGDPFGGVVNVSVKSGGTTLLRFRIASNERVVLPLTQPLPVDEIAVIDCFGRTFCFAEFNIVGS